LYRGNSLWQFQTDLYCTLVSSPSPSLPLYPLPTPLQAITRGFIVLFHLGIWSPSTMFLHLNLLRSPSSLSQAPPHTVPILQSCRSLLISKSLFKGLLNVSLLRLYFTLVYWNPSITLPYPFPPTPSICFSSDGTLALLDLHIHQTANLFPIPECQS
jgi:hypothetical protein